MKRIKGVLLAALLTVTVSMPVYADRSEKVELPQSSTDYYMTVDSGEDGVDIYPSTDKKVEINGTEIKDGTVLHIEGETEKDGENWGYTEYQGRHGYVPLDELRPSKDEELAAAGITKGTGADSAGTGIERGSELTRRDHPKPGRNRMTVVAVSGTPRESDDSTDVSGTEKEVSSGGTGEVYGPAVQISPVSTEEQEETDAKPVNGSVAKSFKETKVWYRNPFIWIGTATALAVIGIFGYHLKKRG